MHNENVNIHAGVIEQVYKQVCEAPSTINEHLPILKSYAEQCDSIIEFGTWLAIGSTWALLAGKPEWIYCVDYKYHPNLETVRQAAHANNITFGFFMGYTTDFPVIDVDMLFIDATHTYEAVKEELDFFGDGVQKFIAFHDTETFGSVGSDKGQGIRLAITEFMKTRPEWNVVEDRKNNNGLMVISRTGEDNGKEYT